MYTIAGVLSYELESLCLWKCILFYEDASLPVEQSGKMFVHDFE